MLQALVAPLVLALAGREVLGAYAIIYQALAYLALMDFGSVQALERYLAQCVGRPDADGEFREIFTAFRAFLLCSNLAFSGLVLLFAARFASMFSMSGVLLHDARVGLICIALWALLRTPLSAFGSALIATQNLAAINVIATMSNALRLVLSVVFLKMHLSLLGLMWAALGAEILGTLVSRYIFLRKYPGRAPLWEWRLLAAMRRVRGMWSYSANAFVVQLTTVIIFNSAALFAGWMHGPVAASVLYTTQLPGLVAYNVVFRLHDNFGPALNEMWGSADNTGFARAFRHLADASLALSATVGCGILLFNGRVITAWVGGVQYAGILATVAVAVAAVSYTFDHLYGQLVLVVGDAKVLARVCCVQAIAYLIAVIVLGRYLGVGGILLAGPVTDLPKMFYLRNWLYRRVQPSHSSDYRALVQFAGGLTLAVLACLWYFRTFGTAWTRLNLITGIVLFGVFVLVGCMRLLPLRRLLRA